MSEGNLGHEVHIAGGLPGPKFVSHANPSIRHEYDDEVAGVLLGSGDDDKDLPQDVRDLIARCMSGDEPKQRAPRPQDPDKLSVRHISMCMLRAAGFRTGEIAGVMGLTFATVSNALCCEYGQKVVRAIMYARGTRVLDIRTRLDEYASDVLDHIHNLTQQSQDLEVVSKVGFGLLDRAGYGTVAKVQNLPPSAPVTASEHHLSRIASALDLSASVDASVMPTHVESRPPEDTVQVPSPDGVSSHQAPGPALPVEPSPQAVDTPAMVVRLTKVGN